MATKHLRQRGTAVVISQGKVLLVRDIGKPKFSFPGGGVKKGEITIVAAARELYEEVGLEALDIQRLTECDFSGSASKHKVCLVSKVKGKPHLRGHELDKFIWWDMESAVPVYAHVREILKKLHLKGYV